jgi:hypothetical protein
VVAEKIFMRPLDAHATALPVPTVPLGIDPHFETENRVVWNDEKHTNEVQEFVYEVSWIPELGVRRHFLRSHRLAERRREVP